MLRWIISAALIAAGVMLAEDVGHVSGTLHRFISRNRLTVAVTECLSERAPSFLLRFEQDILFYFPLAPYFFVVGVIAGLCFAYSKAKCGVLFAAAYAGWFNFLLIRRTVGAEKLSWYMFLDVILCCIALVPIYLIGVNVGRAVVERRCPRWRLSDVFTAVTICGILLFAIVYRPFIAIPAILSLTSVLLAWRTAPSTANIQVNGGDKSLESSQPS
jgi:hypothetical protein